MKKYCFDWDLKKEKSNFSKHKVTFQEAATVFEDRLAKIFGDQGHSSFEEREIIIGHSVSGRLLLVVFTQIDSRIRIISARMATKRERKDYEENVFH